MRVPSGDQAALAICPLASVSRVGLLPSMFISHKSGLPPRSETKAMRVPSGDQVGNESEAGSLVRRVWLLPSASMMYISLLPSRSEWKARRVASGDQAGPRSRELLSVSWVRLLTVRFNYEYFKVAAAEDGIEGNQ